MRNLDVFGALKGNYSPQNAFLDEACLLLEHYIFNALRRAYKLEPESKVAVGSTTFKCKLSQQNNTANINGQVLLFFYRARNMILSHLSF